MSEIWHHDCYLLPVSGTFGELINYDDYEL